VLSADLVWNPATKQKSLKFKKFALVHNQYHFGKRLSTFLIFRPQLMVSQKVIPEVLLVGNLACKVLKSWMPDKNIRA
jgi:hypothetical protein